MDHTGDGKSGSNGPGHAGKFGSLAKDKVELLLWRKVCVSKTMTLDQAKAAYLKGWTKLLPEKVRRTFLDRDRSELRHREAEQTKSLAPRPRIRYLCCGATEGFFEDLECVECDCACTRELPAFLRPVRAIMQKLGLNEFSAF
jgi:hypothetical protein